MCSPTDVRSKTPSVRRQRLSPRKKLWQLEIAYHCSIIGTCLSLKELRQTAKKFDLALQGEMTDYELHGAFVNSACTPNEPTRYIHKLLEKKYSQTIRKFSKTTTESEVVRLWDESIDSGNVGAAFWAILTGPEVSAGLLQRVIGEIHMLSHISGASTRSDIRSLGKLRDQQTLARDTYDKNSRLMEKRLRKKDVEILTLRTEKEGHLQEIQELEKSRQRLHEIELDGKYAQLELMVENVTGQFYKALSRANQSDTCIGELEQRIMQLESEKSSAEKTVDEYRSQLQAVEVTLDRALDSHCADICELSETSACPLNDLKGMNILYVGGRASQCAHLRTMVEQYNGEFIYHDGGRHDGRQRLDSVLAQADTVVFPMDCVSHDAYFCIKKHCERLDKKLVMIPHASLSAFAKGLEEVAA
ncbi:hypothetical protein A9Q81_17535 [Gammaproteobacteria bacterium 42_54_T18]|mgnify:CR=1 FL=1|nr:hypothetical protein A9Q81_17535 [Gammaproteobacteria bacterium 42_54_T18]